MDQHFLATTTKCDKTKYNYDNTNINNDKTKKIIFYFNKI
jgi:hypothetical protein